MRRGTHRALLAAPSTIIPVSLDAFSTFNNANGDIDSLSHTVGSGATLLLAIFGQLNPTAPGPSPVWDPTGSNQAMTSIAQRNTADGSTTTIVYGLLNPTPATAVVRITGTVGARTDLCVLSLKNTATSSLAAAVPTITTAASAGTESAWYITQNTSEDWIFGSGYYGGIANRFSNGISGGSSSFGNSPSTSDTWTNTSFKHSGTSPLSSQSALPVGADYCSAIAFTVAPAT